MVVSVLLDLSAAFDLVYAYILDRKLMVFGLSEDFIDWVSSYLADRKQAVWINHTFSDWLDVNVSGP